MHRVASLLFACILICFTFANVEPIAALGGGAGGGAGGAAGAAAGAAGAAAGAAGSAAGSAGNAAGNAASGVGSAASGVGSAVSGAVGSVGNAASGAIGSVGNAASSALGSIGSTVSSIGDSLGIGSLGAGIGPSPKAVADYRKAMLTLFRAESPGEQLRVRRQCVDVLRHPQEYDRGLVDLCAILKLSKLVGPASRN